MDTIRFGSAIAAVLLLGACEAHCVEVSIQFEQDVPLSRVREINAEIDAEIVVYPIDGNLYIVRLRPGMSVEEAVDYYESFTDEVVAAGPPPRPVRPRDGPDGAQAAPRAPNGLFPA